MNLYDDIILQIEALTKDKKEIPLTSTIPEVKNNMIFQSDVAYEIGGGLLPSISLTLPTTQEIENSLFLLGKDLCEIHTNSPLIRIAILQIHESEKTAEAEYQMIKRLDFTKYHVNPEGYMMRISSMRNKETVRISKNAILKRISFSDIGYHFNKAYHRHKEVISVKQIYITDSSFDYEKIIALSKQVKERTNLIDHMTKDLSMSCGTCHLKPICDEVEGMKELHENSAKATD